KNLSLFKKHDIKITKLINEDEILTKRANSITAFIDDQIQNLQNKPINWNDLRLYLSEFLYLHSPTKQKEINSLDDLFTINTEKLDSIKVCLESHKETINSFEKNELITNELQEINKTIDVLDTFHKEFKNNAIQLTID